MKILAVKLADLGDMLLSEPALRSLRIAFPTATIDVLTTPHAAQLLPHFDLNLEPLAFEKTTFDRFGTGALLSIGRVGRLAVQLRRAGYDLVVLLHHLTTRNGVAKHRALVRAAGATQVAGLDNGRGDFLTHRASDLGFGAKHEAEYMLDVARAAGGAETLAQPRFRIVDEELDFALPSRYIAVAPGAGGYSPAKAWPAERFAALSRNLAARGRSIVILGGSDANPAASRIVDAVGTDMATDLTGRTTINQTAIALSRAQLLVGNDSFPAHLGAAVGTPVLAIFGPSNADAWQPHSPETRILAAGLPCAPCLYTGYRLGRRDGCPSRSCLGSITPEMALEATMEILHA